MSRKRRFGVAFLVLGMVVMACAALLSSAATAAAGSGVEPAAPPASLGIGWLLGLFGLLMSFTGVVMTANDRGAFF